MKRAVVLLVAATAMVGGGPGAARAQAGADAPLTLAELEQLALEHNPTIGAARAGVDAARGLVRQAGAWPNPIVGYTAEEITGRGDVDPRGQQGVFVEQTIPLGGKRRFDRAAAEQAAEGALARADLQRQRVLSSVRTLFYEILTAERRIEVLERLAALGSEAVEVTAQLYNVGAADWPDHLESEIETRRVQLDLTAARNDLFARRQRLAAVVGREDVAARRLSGTIDEALPELEREAVMRALVDQSPQLRAARAAVARARALTSRARSETTPDLFVKGGAAYNRERGEDTGRAIGWEGLFEAGIRVPLFNRNEGAIAAARAGEAAAEAEVRRLELALRAEAAQEFAAYLTALRAAESYRADILPRAEQAYRLYMTRYREMGAAYPQVLVSQRTLFDTSRTYLEHLEAAWRSALRLRELMAGDGLASPGS